MKTDVAGLLVLVLVSPTVVFADVQWAPETAPVRVLPGFVFAWSPGGADLAFAAGRDLWITGPDDWQGGRRFTFEQWDVDGTIEQLVWAPDGSTLAVVTPRRVDQWQSIWLVDVHSGALVDLLPAQVSDVFGSPGIRAVRVGTWLDTRSIAFLQRCGTGCVAVHRVTLEPRTYAHYCVAGADGDFAWDPAGRWAIFGAHLGALGFIDLGQPGDAPWRECNTVLAGYDAQTSVGDWYEFESATADGRKVLLRRHAGPAAATGLAVWDLHGPPTDLVRGGMLATWSPDAQQIALVRLAQAQSRGASATLDAELVLLDNSAEVRVLAPLGSVSAASQGAELARPVWSPDGRRLVAQDVSGRVLLLQPDGGLPPRELLKGEPARTRWSADSQWLIVQVATGGVPEIGTAYLLRAGGVQP